MRLLDYRLVIIDNEGELNKYSFNYEMHQGCLDDFAIKNGYEYSNLDYLVDKGNCIFYNCGNDIVVAKLPSNLNSRQLYTLDYLDNCLDDIFLLQINKGHGKEMVNFSYDSDIKKNFSYNVVQSYYKDNKKNR